MIDTVKSLVHQLTNQMQVVLGYLEIDDVESALKAAKDSSKTLRQLTRMLATAYESDPNQKAG